MCDRWTSTPIVLTLAVPTSPKAISCLHVLSLWRGQDDKWCYSRIYAGRAAHRETLIEHLEKAGVEDIENAHCRVNCSFSVPLGYFNGDKVMPVPYIDSRPFSTVQVKVDDTHFTVSMGGKRKDSKDGWQFPSLQSTTGAFFPSEYHGCENCGSEINMDDDCFIRVNSDIYCSHDCATDYDAIRICTSDSHEYVYDRDVPDGVVFNGFNVDYVFSNRQAAINRGSLYRVVPWAETEEPMFSNQPSTMSVMWSGQWSSSMPRHPHG